MMERLREVGPVCVVKLEARFVDEADVVRELEARIEVRVLIVRIGAMGDVLHAMPAVAALRERHPEWFIGWAIEPRWSDLLQIAGDPDDLSQGVGRFDGARRWSTGGTAWPRASGSGVRCREDAVGDFALRRVLQGERFDVCVDMQGALKSAVVGRMAGRRCLRGRRAEGADGAVVLPAAGGGGGGACGGAGVRAAGRGGGRAVAAGAGDAADGCGGRALGA
jgi:hypothetical protein